MEPIKPFDWKRRLADSRRRARELEHEIKPPAPVVEQKVPTLPLYNVIKVERGHRRAIAWRVPLNEAEMLTRAAEKRITKLSQPDDSGNPQFEITQTEFERIQPV